MQKAKFAIGLTFFLAAFCVQRPAFGQFQPALPGYEFQFPRDHGTHNEYPIEWWYYTGHLQTKDGARYGFELTFFRVGIVPAEQESSWDLRNLALAHFAISDLDSREFRYYEKLNRFSIYTANAAQGRLEVFNEGWRASTLSDGAWRIHAKEGKDSLDLVLRSRKPPAVHGENGISVKAAGFGYASHDYSMTRLEAAGSINGQSCTGEVWMDHEFGSSRLQENQRGWDWFSVDLVNVTKMMLYLMRRMDGGIDAVSSGSLITSEGEVIHLRRDQFQIKATSTWKSRRSGAVYPSGWLIEVPTLRLALTLTPLLKDQELLTKSSTGITYWEGAIGVNGSFADNAVRGEGYVELTGYDKPYRAP